MRRGLASALALVALLASAAPGAAAPTREVVILTSFPKELFELRQSPRPRGASRAHEVATMPRVREIEDDGGDSTLKEIFARERELFGAVFNTTKIYAHCPPVLKAAKQLSVSIEKSGRLPAALLPLVYLRVALINGCPF